MQWKQAALAAVVAGGAIVGIEALRSASDAPEADAADQLVAEEPAPAQVPPAVAESPPAPATEPSPTEIETRLADAEAERDRLRLALADAAAERDALAETLAKLEAEAAAAAAEPETAPQPLVAAESPSEAAAAPAAEIDELLDDLATQAAEIDRLKHELTARDAELAVLRETAEVLPVIGPETPAAVLVVAQDPDAMAAAAASDAEFAARLEAAKSGLPLPRPIPAGAVATAPGAAPLALVLFERGSATLTTGGADRAAEAAASITGLSPTRVRVTGHSDTTGSPDANMRLSRARAEAVAAALIAAGLPADRIEIAPHGQAAEALPIPTGLGVAEPLNRCAGIFVMAAAD